MRHATRPAWRAPLALLILTTLLGAAIPSAARAATALAALTASPADLSLSIPLGQQRTRTITLTNATAAPITPLIYAAQPSAAPGATLSADAPTRPLSVPLPHQAERLDPQLRDDLARAPDRRGDFVVYLRDQADLGAAYGMTDWAARGRYVYRTLADWAERRQSGLRRQISARGLAYRPLWIANAVLVHGALADAQALSERDDVALVRANRATALPLDAPAPAAAPDLCSPDQPGNPICWNIRQIRADRVWRDFGVSGQGIVVASVDTGVSYTHPALASRYRGYLGPGRYDHDYNWFDPQGILGAPGDGSGHGTHTMGTMVAAGDGTTAQPSVGVAPGARWIAAQGCDAYFCAESALLEAAQWILAPTTQEGAQPRPDLRPMIVNNSWAGASGDSWYAGYTAAWRAAGIFPVFATGNAGGGAVQTCGSVESPADYADVVAVGANDATGKITTFSLFGPTPDGRMKPDFVAPGTYSSGQGVLSTGLGAGGYVALQGTSMATPHVAGLVALLWSANPALIGDYDATYAILRDSARRWSDGRCGDAPGAPNNIYGNGRIDAYAAIVRARVALPWLSAPATLAPIAPGSSADFDIALDAGRVPQPGVYRARIQIYAGDLGQTPTTIPITLTVAPAAQQATVSGRVVSADAGAPIQATVAAGAGLGAPTDASGAFTLTLALGSYDLVASAPSYFPSRRTINLTGDLRLADIALRPDQPRIAVTAPPLSSNLALAQRANLLLGIRNDGTRPLNYTVRAPHDYYGVWRSDEPGGPTYQWIDLPPGAPTLSLPMNGYQDKVPLGLSFPFYSYSYTQTLVTANGTLAFGAPLRYDGAVNRCLPDDELFFYLIAAFRADLDPSRGGRLRYGTLPDRSAFVLSYEDVPLHDGPLDATYTFQVLLHSDGRIGLQYRRLAALPSKLSVGLQRAPLDLQAIGCGATTPIADGLAIEMRPQPPASYWLRLDDLSGELPPGGRSVISIPLAWVRPNMPWPYRGRLEIVSSDPIRSLIVAPIQIQMLPAPHELWFPLMPNYS